MMNMLKKIWPNQKISTKSMEELIEMLKSNPLDDVKIGIIQELRERPVVDGACNESLKKVLTQQLDSANRNVVAEAGKALVPKVILFGQEANTVPKICASLIKVLDSEESNKIKIKIMEKLGEMAVIGNISDEITACLVKIYKGADKELSKAAWLVLRKKKLVCEALFKKITVHLEKSTKFFARKLWDSINRDEEDAIWTSKVLSQLGSDEAIEALWTAENSEQNYIVKKNLVRALGQIRSDKAIKIILSIIQLRDIDVGYRIAAVKVLGEIGAGAIEALKTVLLDSECNPDVEKTAKAALNIIEIYEKGELYKICSYEVSNIFSDSVKGDLSDSHTNLSSYINARGITKVDRIVALLQGQCGSYFTDLTQSRQEDIQSQHHILRSAKDKMFQELTEELDVLDRSVREKTMMLLEGTSLGRNVEFLAKLFESDSKSHDVKVWAARALSKTGQVTATDVLIRNIDILAKIIKEVGEKYSSEAEDYYLGYNRFGRIREIDFKIAIDAAKILCKIDPDKGMDIARSCPELDIKLNIMGTIGTAEAINMFFKRLPDPQDTSTIGYPEVHLSYSALKEMRDLALENATRIQLICAKGVNEKELESPISLLDISTIERISNLSYGPGSDRIN